MAALAGLIARYRRPIVYAIAALVLLAGVSGWGYLKGYSRAEDKYKALQVSALEAQKKELEAAHVRQIAALKTKTRGQNVADEIRRMPLPAGGDCDAGHDWLHHLQDAVRKANAAAGVD